MIGPEGFREAIRTATVAYPIPFIFAAALAFALASFGLATLFSDAVRWVVVLTGAAAALTALVLAAYAVIFREDLLRSERHSLVVRYIQALGDGDMDAATRAELRRTIIGFAEEKRPKKAGARSPHGSVRGREGESD
jgi:hypothetical protein